MIVVEKGLPSVVSPIYSPISYLAKDETGDESNLSPKKLEYTLFKTGKNYQDSKAQLPDGYRMSTQEEELVCQLDYEMYHQILERTDKSISLPWDIEVLRRLLGNYAENNCQKEAINYVLSIEGTNAKQDPREAMIFDDIFGRNASKWHALQWTETGLRVPNGMDSDKYETDVNGNKYWERIVLHGNEEIGRILVPEGGGRLVAEWQFYGIPGKTIEADWPHKPYTTHFWFDPTKQNVAVIRRNTWHPDAGERCFDVDASHTRAYANPDAGFRLVKDLK